MISVNCSRHPLDIQIIWTRYTEMWSISDGAILCHNIKLLILKLLDAFRPKHRLYIYRACPVFYSLFSCGGSAVAMFFRSLKDSPQLNTFSTRSLAAVRILY